jgi:nucleoside-diphosphate-sugar epimerase
MSDSNPIIKQDLKYIAEYSLEWHLLSGSTILVSGGSGLLGSYLVKSLLTVNDVFDLGLHVICVTRNSKSVQKRLHEFQESQNLTILLHDITKPLPSDCPSADVIIHAASQASPKYYGSDPVGTLLANTSGTENLLNHAVSCKSSRFLFFSSGEVYGVPSDSSQPIAEQDYGLLDPIKVRSCYAESKRIGETMCAAWNHQYGLRANVVRPFHTYGPGMDLDDGRVYADFVSDVVHHRDIELKSDGLAKRSFCYISDATLGFLTVLLNGLPGEAYNVANPCAEITMKDLACSLSNLFPERGTRVHFSVRPVDGPYLQSPVKYCCPSISKISQLGWNPHLGIEDGFMRTISSYL